MPYGNNIIPNPDGLQGPIYWQFVNASIRKDAAEEYYFFRIEPQGSMSQSIDLSTTHIKASDFEIFYDFRFMTNLNVLDNDLPTIIIKVDYESGNYDEWFFLLTPDAIADWQQVLQTVMMDNASAIVKVTVTIYSNNVILDLGIITMKLNIIVSGETISWESYRDKMILFGLESELPILL